MSFSHVIRRQEVTTSSKSTLYQDQYKFNTLYPPKYDHFEQFKPLKKKPFDALKYIFFKVMLLPLRDKNTMSQTAAQFYNKHK